MYIKRDSDIRPRMEKSHSGRPRTGRLPDCYHGYGTKRPANETLLTLLVQNVSLLKPSRELNYKNDRNIVPLDLIIVLLSFL